MTTKAEDRNAVERFEELLFCSWCSSFFCYVIIIFWGITTKLIEGFDMARKNKLRWGLVFLVVYSVAITLAYLKNYVVAL